MLLIDEIDKTDAEFEAFLFEVLSDFQVSVPEWGTVSAKHIPIVILTSNGERELSDGMKRRCVYLNVGYPSIEKEIAIVNAKVPKLGRSLPGSWPGVLLIFAMSFPCGKIPPLPRLWIGPTVWSSWMRTDSRKSWWKIQ